jgi:hypothetical protein
VRPEPGLDLVGDHQHAVLGADRATPAGSRRRHDHPASPWIGSSSTATVVSSIGRRERVRVAVGHDRKPGRVRAEVVARVGSVEKLTIVVVRPWKLPVDDDVAPPSRHALDLVAPLAGDLDRGLDRLGAGVHRQHQVLAAQLGQLGAERPELVVLERPAGQRDALELPCAAAISRGCRGRSSAPSTRRGSPGSAALDVGHPGALGLGATTGSGW